MRYVPIKYIRDGMIYTQMNYYKETKEKEVYDNLTYIIDTIVSK